MSISEKDKLKVAEWNPLLWLHMTCCDLLMDFADRAAIEADSTAPDERKFLFAIRAVRHVGAMMTAPKPSAMSCIVGQA
jgi:hypothetical protein